VEGTGTPSCQPIRASIPNRRREHGLGEQVSRFLSVHQNRQQVDQPFYVRWYGSKKKRHMDPVGRDPEHAWDSSRSSGPGAFLDDVDQKFVKAFRRFL
jgi:hypothetical protein